MNLRLCLNLTLLVGICLIPLGLVGCRLVPVEEETSGSAADPNCFSLDHITSMQALELLHALGMDAAEVADDLSTVCVNGVAADVHRAKVVLALVDREVDYAVTSLGPASIVRSLPSNEQIAHALGDVALGTFSLPPGSDQPISALIDVHNEQVLLIAPRACQKRIRQAIAIGRAILNEPVANPSGPETKQESDREPRLVNSETTNKHAEPTPESNTVILTDANQKPKVSQSLNASHQDIPFTPPHRSRIPIPCVGCCASLNLHRRGGSTQVKLPRHPWPTVRTSLN